MKNEKYMQVSEIIKNATGDVFPGAVILVCHKGKAILHEPFGVKWYGEIDGLKEEPVTKDTIFDCASMTKIIATGSITMKLFEKGKLNLEEPVCATIKDFKGNGRENVLIHHLLTHSSGLPPWKPFAKQIINYNPSIEPGSHHAKEMILSSICSGGFEYQTGKESIYSDLGFILLGFLLEEKGQNTLNELFRQYITEPLSLNRTFFLPVSHPLPVPKSSFAATEFCPTRKKMLLGEVHDDNSYILGGTAGHAGAFTTAMDFGKWALEIRKGLLGLKGLFKQETLRFFLSRKYSPCGSTRVLAFDTKSKYGSSAGRKFSMKSFGHTGFTGCSFWFDFDRDLFVILLTNRVHPSRENEKIKRFRPRIHDAVVEMIESKF